MAEISEKELNERVAVLRRLRSLLEQQRAKFREYLAVLEKQQDSIAAEDSEALLAHSELEQQVVESIGKIQKVIVPMSDLYRSTVPADKTAEDKSVEEIESELAKLQTQVLRQNERNRELLREHLVLIKQQLDQFTNPYNRAQSVYARNAASARLVEVEA